MGPVHDQPIFFLKGPNSTMLHYYDNYFDPITACFPALARRWTHRATKLRPIHRATSLIRLSPIDRTLLDSPAIYRGAGTRGKSGLDGVEHLCNVTLSN